MDVPATAGSQADIDGQGGIDTAPVRSTPADPVSPMGVQAPPQAGFSMLDAAFPPDVHDKAGPSKQVASGDAPQGPVYVAPHERPPHKPLQNAVKRAVDVAVAGGALMAGAPLLMTIATLVKLDSPGPALYKQVRVGKDGVPFDCLKFRSMTVDAEKDGPRWARSFDARVTRVGGVLRRTSLDELPQLWNIFVGDMSLVGPRPERPVFVAKFRQEFKDYDLRHTIRPGLSGWAQVSGLRGNVSIADRTVYDVWYVRNFSLALDARILVRTFAAVLAGE